MTKYYCYEKIKDKYIIQNNETLEIELIDIDLYNEGKQLGLLSDYNLDGLITRRYIAEESVIFKTNNYKILSRNNSRSYINLNDIDDEDEIIVFVPKIINTISFFTSFSCVSILFVAQGLKGSMQFDDLNFKKIDLSYFDISKLVSMSNMFLECSYLEEVIFGDFDNCIYDVESMFMDCGNLKRVNLNNLNLKNCVNFSHMFHNCMSLKEIDLKGITGEKVNVIKSMFAGCSSLTELDLSSFTLSNCKNIEGMFANCKNLKRIDMRNIDLNVECELPNYLFYECDNLEVVYINKNCKRHLVFTYLQTHNILEVLTYV